MRSKDFDILRFMEDVYRGDKEREREKGEGRGGIRGIEVIN